MFAILKTKIQVPALSRSLVPRPRLHEALTRALQCNLIVVAAPAGFGKTSLIRGWLSTSGLPCAWLSLENSDNDLRRFMTYMVNSLERLYPRLGKELIEKILTVRTIDIESTTIELINKISTLEESFVFVLEDYHCIDTSAIHDLVAFLVEHMPSNMTLVIDSRIDPPFKLGRLRAGGSVMEIRGIDLRFSGIEAETYFNDLQALDLESHAVEQLVEKTEGWIAGLQLASISMEKLDKTDRRSFVQAFTGTDRYILDYLIEEVLQREHPQIREFLMRTSILGRMCSSLCASLFQNSDTTIPVEAGNSSEYLSLLEKRNLFIIPLDSKRGWYRYHHLFAELLQNQLAANSPGFAPDLHRRAAIWFSEQGDISEAINHFLPAGDTEAAAELTERSFFDRMSHGEDFTTMLRRLEALPKEIMQAKPHLIIWFAWMLTIDLHLDEVEPRLGEVETLPEEELSPEIILHMVVIRAELARHRDNPAGAAERALAVLDAVAKSSSTSMLLPQVYLGALFCLSWSKYALKEYSEAQRWFAQTLEVSREAGSITMALLAERGLGLSLLHQGLSDQAENIFKQGMNEIEQHEKRRGSEPTAAAYIYGSIGDLLLERGDFERAADNLSRAIELGTGRLDGETMRDTWLSYSRVKSFQGDFKESDDAISRAEDLAQIHREIPEFETPIFHTKEQLQQERQMCGEVPKGASPDWQDIVPPLSARELEILRLLFTSLTGPEIAEKLFVSTNTIKTHIKNIYGKLGVHSRCDAMEAAGRLNILT